VENRLNVLLFLKNSPIYLDNEKDKIERKNLIASLSPPPKKKDPWNVPIFQRDFSFSLP
jgi:hypothetical protein